ncbi:MAG: DUF6252 family protein [Bacteroidota bacterium]|nr:DUF6252 family protein [Bacteroidota bacterium]
MHYYLFTLISLLLLAGGCKKPDDKPEEPVLPPATQTGAYTFGCRVNGEVWVAKTKTLQLPLVVQYHAGELHIRARRYNNEADTEIDLTYFGGITGPGEYVIRTRFNAGKESQEATYYGTQDYNADTSGSGLLTITRLDTAAEIISGTFYFDAYSSKGDAVHLTDGRFDADF